MKRKICVFGLFILTICVFFSCESKKEEVDPYINGQSYTFKYKDTSPVVGAEVTLRVKWVYEEVIASGTTDENGTVNFTKEEVQNTGYEMPYDLVIYAKKGFYSNIEDLSMHRDYNGESNQNMEFTVNLSFAEALLAPVKWVFANSYYDDSLVTDYVADCSKDNYLEVSTVVDNNGNNSIMISGNDGDLVCSEPYIFYPLIPLTSFGSSNVVMDDNNVLPSGLINHVNSYDVDMLEIRNDTLYLVSQNVYKFAYIPEF